MPEEIRQMHNILYIKVHSSDLSILPFLHVCECGKAIGEILLAYNFLCLLSK